ncbi:MAG: type II toxin-antitoxin system RelE/ParE family toxin [Dehalococcoidia bacterium]|nr:type II toxin-antitoxin system RelE/ParE family toxin [Dehalococcoidia bacterium]
MKVLWTEAAIKDLEKTDKLVARRILKRITWLAGNFEKVTAEPLAGEFKGMFKLRIGNWRAVYSIEGKTIVVQFVGHRGEIYRTR